MTTSALVPGLLPVAIHGHPYLADPTYERETVQVIRQQSDTSTEPGEQSLTPLGLWRRSQESWHHGAGQDFLDGRDEKAADPHRFRSSKGVDVWTRGEVSLHHPTLKVWSTSSTNLHLAVVQQAASLIFHLCLADGTEVYYNTIPLNGINTFAGQTGTGWTPTNATIAASPAGGTPGWMRITATASAVVSLTSPTGTSGVPVWPGQSYSFIASSKNVSGSGAKIPTAVLTWYNAAGAVISTSQTATAVGDDTSGRVAFGSQTSPIGAAFASVTISWTAAWTAGDIHDAVGDSGPMASMGPAAGPDAWMPAGINAGQAAQTVQSLATDGINLWAALGTSGLHRSIPGTPLLGVAPTSTADVPAAPASGQISLVGYANGFLLAAGSAGTTATRQNSLWVVTDPLGTPALSLIKTHPNTSFQWTFIAGGRNVVYAGGNCGGNGEVYKITYDPNTGTLSTAASPATMLPDGETIHALYFYAGGIILGTGKGLRLGQADGAGNIDYGPLIETEWPVRCLEPQDRYCWFGWTKYDVTNSGLGRVDLGYLTDNLTPAWASDLMTADTSTGDAVACVTFAPYGYSANQFSPLRVFTVAGEGVYIEDRATRVATGQILTGAVRYSTSEPKTIRSVDLRHHALPQNSTVSVDVDQDSIGTFTALGSNSVTDSYGKTITTSALSVEAMEFRITLARTNAYGNNYLLSPELTRWTAKVLPTPSTIDETFTLTLLMHETIDTTAADGQPYHMDVQAEIAFIKTLERARTIIEFQVGDETFEGYVLGSKFTGTQWNGPKREYAEGRLAVQLQTARG